MKKDLNENFRDINEQSKIEASGVVNLSRYRII